ncbi:MAG: hypothetical protein KME29_31630 [Calothrix sp. FI2-JRJ7]|nr:hypothetical protein [Calothrix sp. FI2-JRJ7]
MSWPLRQNILRRQQLDQLLDDSRIDNDIQSQHSNKVVPSLIGYLVTSFFDSWILYANMSFCPKSNNFSLVGMSLATPLKNPET